MADQENITLLIALGCMAFCCLIVAFIVFVVKYQRKVHEKDAKIKAVHLLKQIELFSASAEAEEREKERIARNLHDEINPLLTVLKQNLERHRLYIFKNKFDLESFNADFVIIDRAIEGLRTISYDLLPSFMLEYGLIKSLEDYIRTINDAGIISAGFMNKAYFKEEFPFIKQEQLNIYRVCLEIMNNILKHSSCTSLNLAITDLNNCLVVEFTHNGKGMSNSEIRVLTALKGGLGLKSMQARLLILGAKIDYTKNVETSSIKINIPYKYA